MRGSMIVLALVGAGWSGVAPAQSGDTRAVSGRVDRLEREMRAVQRKVFPAGTPIEPQITGPVAGPAAAPGSPASGAVDDLTERVASLEQQIAGITGQVEQAGYRTRQLEEAFNAYKAATDARLRTLDAGGSGADAAGDTGVGGPAGGGTTTAIDRSPATTRPAQVARPESPRGGPSAVRPNSARIEAVQAVEKPATGDAAEDTYTYGYRLWDAKFYPEAQAQLKTVGDKWPKHRRASFAQNLLGRAYLDEGKPALASVALYDSYKKWPDGERAPDSLYYLGQSLTRLKKPADACKVYDELTDVYAGRMSTGLRGQVDKGRTDAKCR